MFNTKTNNSLQEVWGVLKSQNIQNHQSLDLNQPVITIGRTSKNNYQIDDQRLSGTHCKLFVQEGLFFIEDLSTNGTFVNNTKCIFKIIYIIHQILIFSFNLLGKNNKLQIHIGDIIHLLHESKLGKNNSQIICYCLENVQNSPIEKRSRPLELLYKENQNDKKIKLNKQDDIFSTMQCNICMDIIYECVTVFDCLHQFCGGCYSEWLLKSDSCPTCRNKVLAAKKNPQVNQMVEAFLQLNPSLKRPQEELDELHQKNLITMEKLTLAKLRPKLKNNQNYIQNNDSEFTDFTLSEDDDELDHIQQTQNRFECLKCQQGDCSPQFPHYECINCQKKYPNQSLREQTCEICEQPMCNLYYGNCQGMNENFKIHKYEDYILQNKFPSHISQNFFRHNIVESQILNQYLLQNNICTKDIINIMNSKFMSKNEFTFQINRKITFNFIEDLGDVEKIVNFDTILCKTCFDKTFFQLVFRFRQNIRDELPLEIKSLEDCFYGINCKTMSHNQNHAQKFNHICEQTKFR